jgi:Lanthionine synthetase C-like protein
VTTGHEPLTEAEWDDARAEEGVAAIVAEAEASLVDDAWPNHELDDEGDLHDGMTCVYIGGAGMIWALAKLGSTLDLERLARGALDRFHERIDFDGEALGLLTGEAGIVLTAIVLGADGLRDRLREVVVENERNPSWELMLGSPGTMLAARAAGLDAEWARSAEILVAEWDAAEDGLWTQHHVGKTVQYVGPVHGFAGNVHALRGYFDDAELRRRIEPPLRATAVADGELVNWLPTVASEHANRVQWCHGAPGVVSTLGDLLPEDLLLGGAEFTWRAGPLAKGHGLCHGTAGNGYAFLRTYRVTGDAVWLDRARRFAMHALEQVDRARARYGRGRFTLFTGDVGAALFARACVNGDDRFPTIDVW